MAAVWKPRGKAQQRVAASHIIEVVRRLVLGDNTPLGVLIAAAAAAAGIAAFKWCCDGKKSLELWRPGLLGAGRSEGATLMISDDSIASWGQMGIFSRSWPCSKSQTSISQA